MPILAYALEGYAKAVADTSTKPLEDASHDHVPGTCDDEAIELFRLVDRAQLAAAPFELEPALSLPAMGRTV